MNWIDYAILAVVVISTIVGLWRGFTREVFGLLTWVAAFILAWMYGPVLAPRLGLLGLHLDDTDVQLYLAYALVFVAVFIVGAVIAAIAVRWVRSGGLSGADGSLGACVGFLRGMVIVVAVVMIVMARGDLNRPLWRSSILVPKLTPLAGQLSQWVPGTWVAPLADRPAGDPIDPVTAGLKSNGG